MHAFRTRLTLEGREAHAKPIAPSHPTRSPQDARHASTAMPPPHPLPDPRTLLTALVNALPPEPANTTTSNPLATLPQSSKNLLLTLHVLFPHELLPALDLLDRRLVTRFQIHTRASRSDVSTAPGSKASTSTSTAPALRAPSPPEQRSSADAAPSIARTASQDANASPNSHVSGLIRTAGAPSQDAEIAGDADVEGVAGEDAASRRRGAVPRNPELACGSASVGAGSYVYYVRSAQRRTSRYGTSIDATSSYEVRLRAWNCSCPAFAFAAFPASVVGTEGEAVLDEEQERDTRAGWKFGGVGLGGGTPPVCKHLLACVLGEWCELFKGFIEERDVSVEEAAGWAAGWGD